MGTIIYLGLYALLKLNGEGIKINNLVKRTTQWAENKNKKLNGYFSFGIIIYHPQNGLLSL